jgi:methionine-R-sulfoxide reductase
MWKIINKNYLWDYLSEVQNNVCYANATEAPYSNEYHDFDEAGIYVDITDGKVLFLSIDKYTSHCGWPSFTKPISEEVIEYIDDSTHWMTRIEVRTKQSDIHLWHVFSDGPQESGWRRFCINWVTLDFVEYDMLEESGYGEYKKYFDED